MTFNIEYKWKFHNEYYESSYPAESDRDNNIFKICGKNENGKTTTLKILAFAFGNLDLNTSDINKEIIDEVLDLEDIDSDLSFNILIQSPDHNATVECSYSNHEKTFKIDGRDAGETEIMDKFIVLFETPDSLQNKLKNSIKNIENRFKHYSDLVSRYNDKLEALYKELTDYNNAEKNRKESINIITNLKANLKSYNDLEKEYADEETSIKRQYILFEYNRLENDFRLADDKSKKLDESIRKNQGHEKRTDKMNKNLVSECSDLNNLIDSSKGLFRKWIREDQLGEFEKILKDANSLNNVETINNTIQNVYAFYNKQRSIASASPNLSDKNYKLKQELELIKKLLGVIEEYENIDTELPGANIRITKLIMPLQVREGELTKIVGDDQNLKSIISKCDEIIQKCEKITSILKNFKGRKSDKTEEEDDIDIEILIKEKKQQDDKIDQIIKELEEIEKEYNLIPENERNGFDIDPNVGERYNKIKSAREELLKKITKTEGDISTQEEILKRFDNILPPKSDMTDEEIKKKSTIINNLMSKLNNYINNIKNIDLRKMKLNDSEKNEGFELYSKIGEYLAKVVGVIYHNKKPFKIQNIDFANGEYILEDGPGTIKFNKIGTGTRALNALSTKVRQVSNRKKKIILIDEIGDMDNDNQKLMLDILKDQIKKGDTLLALLTERDDSITKVRAIPVPLD